MPVLFDEELVRMTFVIGIAISVMTYERTHRTTGSLVVPGYIGAQLLNPLALLVTAVNAVLTWWIVAVQLPRVVAVFGRQLFVVNIVVSVLLSIVFGPVVAMFVPEGLPRLDSIGYVIPALIAYDMNRQGVHRTVSTVSSTGALAALPALLIVALRPTTVEPALPVETVLFSFDEFWLALAAMLSVGVAAVLNASHQLRCGGFIGAMYIGLMAGEPAAIAFVLGVAIMTWAFVEFVLKQLMIVFGRRKFAIVLMTGSLASWIALETVGQLFPGSLALEGLPIAVLFVPALLANDMERSSVGEVIVGTVLAGACLISTLFVVAALVDGAALSMLAIWLMVLSWSIVAAPWWAPQITTVFAARRTKVRPLPVRTVDAALVL